MIFAKLNEYPSTETMLGVLAKEFDNIEWADQGTEDMPDAYFWIRDGKDTVAVDNLSSHEYQVKSSVRGTPLIQRVIDVLSNSFSVEVFINPELEPHE
jgi:hypothetical protein